MDGNIHCRAHYYGGRGHYSGDSCGCDIPQPPHGGNNNLPQSSLSAGLIICLILTGILIFKYTTNVKRNSNYKNRKAN